MQFRKQELDEKEILESENRSIDMLNTLVHRQETRIAKYESNIRQKVQNAQDHCQKVDKVYAQCVENDGLKIENRLERLVQKSMLTEQKVDKKGEKAREEALRMK